MTMTTQQTLTHALVWATLVLSPASGRAQEWNNPAERYADAHKKYVGASAPIPDDGIKHFVYFARDRDALRDHPLLTHPRLQGAQVMYAWSQLEPSEGTYDFSAIAEDVAYLRSHGKQLFIQLQDRTFNPQFRGVPEYLLTPEYGGGVIAQQAEDGSVIGWIAKQWNPQMRVRFAVLLDELGHTFDGEIEGINLQETAIDIRPTDDPAFSPKGYAAAVKANMTALRSAFPQSVTMQYANFMPGEWLPWEDEGYLRGIYAHGQSIGVGLGAPDLMPQRKAQLNHALAMMHETKLTVPRGIAIQDGNYIGRTGADDDRAEKKPTRELPPADRKNLVPSLHAFAADFLGVDYMFWVNQEPYFTDHVLPSLGDD